MFGRPVFSWLVAVALALQAAWAPGFVTGRAADAVARATAAPFCAPSGSRTHVVTPDGRLLPAEPDKDTGSPFHCPDCRLVAPLPGLEPAIVVLPVPSVAIVVLRSAWHAPDLSPLRVRAGSARGPPLSI